MDQYTIIAILTQTYTIGSTLSSSTVSQRTTSMHPNSLTSLLTSFTTSTISSSISTETSTSTLSHATFSNMPTVPALLGGSSSTNNSSNVALAIGIPIGVLSLFAAVLFGWYYLKRRVFAKRRADLEPFKSISIPRNINTQDHVNSINLEKTYLNNDDNAMKYDQTDIKYNEGPQKPINIKSNLFQSKLISKQGVAADFKQTTPIIPKRFSGMISPMFLKKFNLSQSTGAKSPSNLYKQDNGDSVESIKVDLNGKQEISSKSAVLILPPVVNIPNTPSSLRNMENSVDNVSDRDESFQKRAVYTVTRAYEKVLNDEISVSPGEKVIVSRNHSDGWCLVIKKDSNEVGMVPKMCLKYKPSSRN